MNLFNKATKEQSKLRLAIYGPSGGGKTFTALGLATGLTDSSDKIYLLDTEFGSASKYADHFDFITADLSKDKSIENLIYVMAEASKADCEVLIIDSLSHAWKELLHEIDKLAHAKFKGNTWAAWSEGTPKQQRLVDAILSFPGHVIATIRAKTEWSMDEQKRPQRVGLAPEQGKGIEYEFDMLMSITPEHTVYVEKDRTGKFQDKIIENPGKEFGLQIGEWLGTGEKSQKTKNLEELEIVGKALYNGNWEAKRPELTSHLVKGRTDVPGMLQEHELSKLIRLLKGQLEVKANKEAQPVVAPTPEPVAEPAVYEDQEELVVVPNGNQAELLPVNPVSMNDFNANDIDDDLPF